MSTAPTDDAPFTTGECAPRRKNGQYSPIHNGFKKHKSTYYVWAMMKERCLNRNNPQYKNYGARGISVCDKWLHSFPSFFADMGIKPADRTIDRINNDGNYEPSNCRWATKAEQRANCRSVRLITLRGETHPCDVWADLFDVPPTTFRAFMKKREKRILFAAWRSATSLHRSGYDAQKVFEVLPEIMTYIESLSSGDDYANVLRINLRRKQKP